MPNKKISEILDKELTRKQFLIHMGVLLLALTGIPALLKNLVNDLGVQKTPQLEGYGYGASAYSGVPVQSSAGNKLTSRLSG